MIGIQSSSVGSIGRVIGSRALECLASEEQWTKDGSVCHDHGNGFFDCRPNQYLGQTLGIGDGNDTSNDGGDHGE